MMQFERKWTLFIKLNNDAWEKEKFKYIYKITNVKEMWQVLNNIPTGLAGCSNIFFMEENLLPLWEDNKQVWERGGCWSTIIKGIEWKKTMNEICMLIMGECIFDMDNIKGICIVPVTTTHCIVKLWATDKSDKNCELLKNNLSELQCCMPRFKAFVA